jgi:hypothetical protein
MTTESQRYNCFTRNGGNAIPKHAGPEAKGSNPTAGLTCSGPVTHSGEILTTGNSHGKKPDRFARLPRVMKYYSPTGRRNHGRPLKGLPDTWDRNGSTSGPTPVQIYDDDYYFDGCSYAPDVPPILPDTKSTAETRYNIQRISAREEIFLISKTSSSLSTNTLSRGEEPRPRHWSPTTIY